MEDDVKNGGAGSVIVWPDGEEEEELKTPAGRHCFLYRAEMLALASRLERLLDNPLDHDTPIVICTDSTASLATLREGATAQTSPLSVVSQLSGQGHRKIQD